MGSLGGLPEIQQESGSIALMSWLRGTLHQQVPLHSRAVHLGPPGLTSSIGRRVRDILYCPLLKRRPLTQPLSVGLLLDSLYKLDSLIRVGFAIKFRLDYTL